MKEANLIEYDILKEEYRHLDREVKQNIENLLCAMLSHLQSSDYEINHPVTFYQNLFLLSELSEKLIESAEKISDFIAVEYDFNHNIYDAAHHLNQNLHHASIALSIINFLKTPFEYFEAWYQGANIDNQLQKNSRWAQAGLLLAMSITAFFMPNTALAFGLGAAMVSIGGALISLANLFYEKQSLNESLTLLERSINEKEEAQSRLVEEAEKKLEAFYYALECQDTQLIKTCSQECEEIGLVLTYQNKLLQSQYAQKDEIEQELAKKGTIAILDRSIGILLPFTAVIGIMTIMLSPPPTGIAILASVTAMGFTYVIGRFLAPTVAKGISWVKSKFQPVPALKNDEDLDQSKLVEQQDFDDPNELERQHQERMLASKEDYPLQSPYGFSPTLILKLMENDQQNPIQKKKTSLNHLDEENVEIFEQVNQDHTCQTISKDTDSNKSEGIENSEEDLLHQAHM